MVNPRYAGAFVYGRSRQRRRPDGGVEFRRLAQADWAVLLPDRHPGYISWERFEANRRQLRANAQAHGAGRRRSPPREGPALLQGLAICGVCGQRMTVRYHTRRDGPRPDYVCQRKAIDTATAKCQTIPGAGIDRAIGELLVELVTPVTLDVALQVQAELTARAEHADAWHAQAVQRAREDADLARQRYMQADPDHRLVADVLEAEWNAKLRALNDAQDELERRRAANRAQLSDEQRRQILALATDFPRLWNDPRTPHRERKRMARLLIQDVTLTRGGVLAVGVRLRGGATRQLTVQPELPAYKRRQTAAEAIADIDELLDRHTEGQIAAILNRRGRHSGTGKPFHARRVAALRRSYGLKTRYRRLRERGLLSVAEMATLLDVSTSTVKKWRQHGLLCAHPYNDKNECLYEPPGENPPTKQQGRKLSKRRHPNELASNRSQEVQCAA